MVTKAEKYRDIADRRDHAAMMKDPDLWPQWPYLPLRNRSREDKSKGINGFVLGFLIAAEDRTKTYVYLGCIYEKSSTRKTERFDTYEDIVAAGWEVD